MTITITIIIHIIASLLSECQYSCCDAQIALGAQNRKLNCFSDTAVVCKNTGATEVNK